MENTDLRRLIVNTLDFIPTLDATRVSVVVDAGIVILSGWANSGEQKDGLVAAVQNIVGVEAVADELEVGPIPGRHRQDADIACQVSAVVRHTIQPAPERLHIRVEQGWVTLSGSVDSFFLGKDIEHEVARLTDVQGITNAINHRADPSSDDVASQIRVVLERDLFQFPDGLNVTSFGGKVTIEGPVHSVTERDLIVRTAGLIDGVTFVDDRMTVTDVAVDT